MLSALLIAAIAIYQTRQNTSDIETKVDKDVHNVQIGHLSDDVDEVKTDVKELKENADENTEKILDAIQDIKSE